ncbi:MAG: hypothetical protein ACLFUU_10935 [Desulfobacteraceae bacterium]
MQLDIIALAISSLLGVFSGLLVTSMIWPVICLPIEVIARLRYGVNSGSAWLNIYLGRTSRLQAVVSSTPDQL